MKRLALILLFAAAPMALAAAPADTIFVHDRGILPDTGKDCTAAVRDLLGGIDGDCVVVFDRGRYDFTRESATAEKVFISNTSSEAECPDKTKHFGVWISGKENLRIVGDGTLWVFHGDMTPIGISNSSRITLCGIDVDFERPGGSEMTYTEVGKGYAICRLHKDSRYQITGGRLELVGEGWKSEKVHCIKHTPSDGHFTYSRDWRVLSGCEAEELSPGLVRFITPEDFTPEVGTTLTLRDIIRREVGTLIQYSSDVTLKGMHYQYMHGLGVISQYARNVSVTGCEFAPDPASGRLLASSADFLHFSGCSGHIAVTNCSFCGAQDDCINVHGTNLRIMEAHGKTLKVRFMHPQSYGYDAFRTGEKVAFVDPERMVRYFRARVTGVSRLSDREIELTLDRNVPEELVLERDCLENMTCTPDVYIARNTFTRTSTRGVLVTTPRRVVIEDNEFVSTGMSAILIESDALDWFESGPVRNVTIRRNTFTDCAFNGGPDHATIGINPSNTMVGADFPVHRNIRITGNTFELRYGPALSAKSVRGLTFNGNAVGREDTNVLWGCSKVKTDFPYIEK